MHTILQILEEMYPNPQTALHHSTPFQLLVATILSAQCTDERVNLITPALFAKYPDAHALAKAHVSDVAELIKTAGLWQTKAKNLVAAAKMLIEEYAGELPRTREELEKLPGVGRKTANVVLANAFGVPAIAVDTHVFRVANRLGLAQGKTPLEVEQRLMEVIPKEKWADAHHWLIYHGRQVCHARKPKCAICPLKCCCAYYASEVKLQSVPEENHQHNDHD
jgi:endonuclease-3